MKQLHVLTHVHEGCVAGRWKTRGCGAADREARATLESRGRGEVFVRPEDAPESCVRYWYDVAEGCVLTELE